MSTELEQLLRGGMERFTEDIGIPAGLARRAYRHRQKQRTRARVATAAGTATVLAAGAVTAAGVAGAFGSASGHLRVTQATADAYVLTRVKHALAAPSLDNMLSSARTIYQPGTTLKPVGPTAVQVFADAGVSSPWTAGYALQWT
jgi:hypothetical protein